MKAYGAYNVNEVIRKKSSSGGIFYSIAMEIIQHDGIVYGVGYDENFRVVHKAAKSEEELLGLLGSKYVQSDLGNTFEHIKEDLKKNKRVLFVGTPCQVSGLKRIVGDAENLFTIDLICHGVPSPMVWEEYVKELGKQKKIDTLNFRDKSLGWNDFTLAIRYKDGSSIVKQRWMEPFMKCFLRDIILRPSCYNCKVKGVERISDLTLADLWGIEELMPNIIDDRGVSLVIVQSERGQQFLAKLTDICMTEIDLQSALKHNRYMKISAPKNDYREQFFREIDENSSIIAYMNKATPVSAKQLWAMMRKSLKIRTHIKKLFSKLKCKE